MTPSNSFNSYNKMLAYNRMQCKRQKLRFSNSIQKTKVVIDFDNVSSCFERIPSCNGGLDRQMCRHLETAHDVLC